MEYLEADLAKIVHDFRRRYKEDLNKWIYVSYRVWETLYYKDVSFPQNGLLILCSFCQTSSKLFYGALIS